MIFHNKKIQLKIRTNIIIRNLLLEFLNQEISKNNSKISKPIFQLKKLQIYLVHKLMNLNNLGSYNSQEHNHL